MKNADLIHIIETGYRLDLPRQQWLDAATRAVADRVGAELGTIGYFYDATDLERAPQVSPLAIASEVDHILGLPRSMSLQQVLDSYPRPLAHASHPRGVVVSRFTYLIREHALSARDIEAWRVVVEQYGFADHFGIVGGNGDGRGVVFTTPLTATEASAELTEAMRRAWTQIATHLAAAERLHRRLGGDVGPDAAAAVIDAVGGRLLHAEGEGRDEVVDARELFEHATRAIDRARGRLRRDEPMEALALWRGLVDGRWSLVEHVEHDGKRVLLAHRNEPHVVDPRRLTRRERQVVDAAVLGHDNNLIAYQLGLSAPTVASHLSCALTKLGIATRTELIALYQQLHHDALQ